MKRWLKAPDERLGQIKRELLRYDLAVHRGHIACGRKTDLQIGRKVSNLAGFHLRAFSQNLHWRSGVTGDVNGPLHLREFPLPLSVGVIYLDGAVAHNYMEVKRSAGAGAGDQWFQHGFQIRRILLAYDVDRGLIDRPLAQVAPVAHQREKTLCSGNLRYFGDGVSLLIADYHVAQVHGPKPAQRGVADLHAAA